eukprot:TRINITY_DN23640_c0_g1_i1.p1 TRINITY_DN23640_c0_g1~~TRINITY_DN23640_c0_g1_i1.p1  ORF type:complete len:140 (-),score=9.00 TRINITY_DN23640_c0_g1_i1:83-502(-)
MKTIKFFLVGMIILIGGFASAKSTKDSQILNNYFLQKALNVNQVKAVLTKNADGDLKPVFIYQHAIPSNKLDPSLTSIHVESLYVTKEDDEVKVVIVYHIDNQIEVTNTFISYNNRDWKAQDTSIHIFKDTVIQYLANS